MDVREPLIWLFESNRKRFATLVTSNNKQKQKSRTNMQRETLHSSNKRCDNLNNQSIETCISDYMECFLPKLVLNFLIRF